VPPISEPVSAPEAPATPVLPDSAVRAAKAIAMQVWSSGSKPRSAYLVGNEANQAEVRQAINHAVDEQWVVVSGDQIVKGNVSPVPMSELPSESSASYRPLRI
jgi:hypothetical protein